MLERFEITTQYADANNSTVSEKSRDPNNTEAKVEYILRQSRSSLLFPFGDQAVAKKLCDQEIARTPQHNFFNYARAQLEKNSQTKQAFLATAAKSCVPYGARISGAAAHELAIELIPKPNESHTPSAAWFSKAIILNNQAAINHFINNNFDNNDKEFGENTLCAIFLTTYLSGIKIAALSKSGLLKNRPFDTTPFVQAYHYPLDTNVFSNIDSPIIKIMQQFIVKSKSAFVTYFCYCMQNDIISEDVFRNLMLFYFNSGYTNQYDLRQKALNIIAEHHLMDKLNYTAPQAPVIYFVPQIPMYTTPYATAPLTPNDNNDAYGNPGSYYFMYTMDPQMLPTPPQTPQSTLVPEYWPTLSLNSAVNYARGEQSNPTADNYYRPTNRS